MGFPYVSSLFPHFVVVASSISLLSTHIVPCKARIQEKSCKNHTKSYYIPATHSASLSNYPRDIILWNKQKSCFIHDIIAQSPTQTIANPYSKWTSTSSCKTDLNTITWQQWPNPISNTPTQHTVTQKRVHMFYEVRKIGPYLHTYWMNLDNLNCAGKVCITAF